MARLMADLRALKEGLDEGLLSQAEFDAAREQCMGPGCDTPAEGAPSHMLAAVQALTKVATALADGVQSPLQVQSEAPSKKRPPPSADLSACLSLLSLLSFHLTLMWEGQV